VNAAIIGSGHYGTAIITQQKYVKHLRVPLVADVNLEAAKNAFIKAEIPPEKIVYASASGEAQRAIAEGKYVYTDSPMIIMDIP